MGKIIGIDLGTRTAAWLLWKVASQRSSQIRKVPGRRIRRSIYKNRGRLVGEPATSGSDKR